MLFSDLGLGPEVQRAVADAGYTQPTPIQEQAIPYVLRGSDVLGCAQTGTGKTASFTLPMIDILGNGRARARMPRSLILEPTRELATQVSANFETYGKYHKLSQALLIGGESFGDQVRKLERGVDVLIATPGRMMDLFDRGNILLSDIKILVIDEADRMLDMGFIPDIERIVGLLPKRRQTLFFSATMPPEIRRLADAFLTAPKEVTVAPPATTATTVTQAIAIVEASDKREALRHLLRTEDVKNAFIFCNRKKDVAILHQSLKRHGFNAGALHGDLAQSVRTETLEAFKADKLHLLVCSDVAARGLDIAGMSHVFNFDVPVNSEDYVHRIGRTGRAGKTGRAFTLATPDEGRMVAQIEKLIGREIPRVALDGLEVADFLPEEEAGRYRRRGGRGGKPERASRSEERSRRGGRGRPDARPENRPEVAPEDRSAPVEAVASEPREEAPRRQTRSPDPRPEPLQQAPRQRHRRDHDRDGDHDTTPVVGFGDDVPAFMGGPARPAPRRAVG